MAAGPGQEPVDVAVTMRTPGNEDELAAGFLVSEGLADPGDIDRVTLGDPAIDSRPDDTITVHLRRALRPGRIVRERRTAATASCGICGTASIEDIARRCPPLPDGPRVDRAVLPHAADHASSRPGHVRFDRRSARLRAVRPGRAPAPRPGGRRPSQRARQAHRCIRAGRARCPLHDTLLLVSGRVSFELVQKAAMAGIPLLVAVGAPTDLAVDTATRMGMTLIGFLRGERCNVYTRPDRLGLET